MKRQVFAASILYPHRRCRGAGEWRARLLWPVRTESYAVAQRCIWQLEDVR